MVNLNIKLSNFLATLRHEMKSLLILLFIDIIKSSNVIIIITTIIAIIIILLLSSLVLLLSSILLLLLFFPSTHYYIFTVFVEGPQWKLSFLLVLCYLWHSVFIYILVYLVIAFSLRLEFVKIVFNILFFFAGLYFALH